MRSREAEHPEPSSRRRPGPSDCTVRTVGHRFAAHSWGESKAFTRLRRASYFLLRGQEKVTTALQEQRERRSRPAGRRAGARSQEKATPMQRSPGILPSDSAQRLRGWLTVHPWTGSQLARIPASHPRIESGAGSSGLVSATAPLHRGPIHCASCAAKTKRIPAFAHLDAGVHFRADGGDCSSFSRSREKVPKADEGLWLLLLLLALARRMRANRAP